MQNLRKNKNKVVTTQMMGLSNEEALDRDMNEDMGRGCKTKHSMMQNNNCCQEPCKEAEPCNKGKLSRKSILIFFDTYLVMYQFIEIQLVTSD